MAWPPLVGRGAWSGFPTLPAGEASCSTAHTTRPGARALAAALAELGVRGFPLVFGAMRGKRVSAVLRALAPLDPRPVFTSVADPHAHSPEELLRTWRRAIPDARGTAAGRVVADPATALSVAADLAPVRGPVVVAGSLYLVGAVRAALTGERVDP